ncbi:MAG: CPBP family intramembrane metalloprotease [Chlorobi bacterium]|nr:CPBP family intramembrane metalloprotease [Chlorobiota bacterium]
MMKKIKSLFALMVIVFIPFGLMIWIRSHQSTGFASVELIAYPLIFGGLSIVLIYLIKKYFLHENIKEFNSGTGKLSTDILWGLALTTIYFILFFIERLTLSGILKFNSNMELLGLMLDMRENPLLLILWFGPVLWIGIALYEELIRVFILTGLWKFSNHKIWSIIVIIISALIIGLAHWSQGSYGIVTIAVKSTISGLFFFKYRRLLPLVVAHVLYDGLQVAMLLITYPQ